jgi:hypothetical protein
MFEYLKDFKTIVVTGPQRSGTTITAAMIAHDTGKDFHPEEDFGVHDEVRFLELLEKGGVIQAPGMCHLANVLPRECMVIFVKRKLEDILKSQKRIGWGEEENKRELKKYGLSEGISAEVKTAFWELQSQLIEHCGYIYYEDLRDHPFWCDDHNKFEARQWQLTQ